MTKKIEKSKHTVKSDAKAKAKTPVKVKAPAKAKPRQRPAPKPFAHLEAPEVVTVDAHGDALKALTEKIASLEAKLDHASQAIMKHEVRCTGCGGRRPLLRSAAEVADLCKRVENATFVAAEVKLLLPQERPAVRH